MDWFNILWEIFPYLFIGVVSVWIFNFVNKRIINFNRTKRLKRGKDAEHGAKRILEKSGYSIHDYQPALNYHFQVDKKSLQVNITPDFIVKKNGVKYIVEVKTGDTAGNPNFSATRRQMLEYNLASELPVLFVNMDELTIEEVRFPFAASSNSINWWKYLSVIMLSVLGITVIAMAVSALLKFL
jgi:hypothetical protein